MTERAHMSLAADLERTLARMEGALAEAAAAAAALRELAPRITGIDSLLRQLEAALSGTAGTETPGAAPLQPASYSRPTLVVPGTHGLGLNGMPSQQPAPGVAVASPVLPELAPAPNGAAEASTSFKMVFESDGEPLDLRAVDDALTAHPAVRDVALLDYDGRRATLKVWISASASLEDVQRTLREQTSLRCSPAARVTIVALGDVA